MYKFLYLFFPLFVFACKSDEKANTDDTEAIRQTLINWNAAVKAKDIDKAMQIFDDNARVTIIGSEPYEIYIGRDTVKSFIIDFLSLNATVQWGMENVEIDQHENTAWAFMNGTVTITGDAGNVSALPYRFLVVMVKRETGWKWRIFHGSEPKVIPPSTDR
jgi:uncharacterized protein (TIGR02246 family)